jgi:hypothetical protein
MRVEVNPGAIFGRWKVVRYLGKGPSRSCMYLCRCECGTERSIRATVLNTGRTKSCGCLGLQNAHAACFKHGHATDGRQSTEYSTWDAMIQRCTNSKNKRFHDYGGRGISVCERWMRFDNFLADMGTRPPGMTLDRKNNDGNYEPGNCRWTTRRQQQLNQRLSSRNTSGFKGVSRKRGRWVAKLGSRYLGCFLFKENASAAYVKALTTATTCTP